MERKIFSRRRKTGGKVRKIVFFALLVALIALEIFAALAVKQSQQPLPAFFGNFAANRARLEKAADKEQFSFAVFGDTEGATGSFDQLAGKLRRQPVDFAVHLGDAYADTSPYFRAELSGDLRMPFPVFFVPGNHDLDGVSLSTFEKTFGPSLFSFVYQDCLFIGLRVSGGADNTTASLRFLAQELADKGDEARRVFVFMHVPTKILPGYKFVASSEFDKLFARYKVDYVFAGHYHGYGHVMQGRTNYIVTGAAGKHLEEDGYGQFYHGLVLTVGQDFVSEEIVLLDKTYDLESKLQRFAIVELYPWLMAHRVLAVALNLVVVLLAILTLRSLRRPKR